MTLSTPGQVIARLEEIDRDLGSMQLEYEKAAFDWFRAKRNREKEEAELFMSADGTVADRHAKAAFASATIGMEEEAKYEAMRAVVRVLETRASIGQSILRSQAKS